MLKELLVKIQNRNEEYVIENLKKRHPCYRVAEGLVDRVLQLNEKVEFVGVLPVVESVITPDNLMNKCCPQYNVLNNPVQLL